MPKKEAACYSLGSSTMVMRLPCRECFRTAYPIEPAVFVRRAKSFDVGTAAADLAFNCPTIVATLVVAEVCRRTAMIL